MSNVSFDAAAILAAMERPVLTVPHPRRPKTGPTITFVGGYLSIEQWASLQDRVMLMQRAELPVEQLKGLIRDLTDAIFPAPPWWAPWRSWASLELAKLPLAVQLEAIETFTASQVAALRVKMPATPTVPLGTTQAASEAMTAT